MTRPLSERSILRLAVCATALSLGVGPSGAETSISPGVPGVLSADGSFRAAAIRPGVVRRAAAPVTFTGTIALTITVTIASDASTISRSAPVKCSLNATVHNADYSDSVAEVSQATVAIVGSQAVCKLAIPYAWPLYDAANDSVYLGYNISFFDDAGNGRNTYIQMPTIGIPANGASIVYSRKARI